MEEIVGVGFRPTDVELVSFYLTNKNQGRGDLVDHVIFTLNPHNLDPWQISPLASDISAGDNVWYFFKLPPAQGNGGRVNRASPGGVWKLTGMDRRITDLLGNVIGIKKTLVFRHLAAPEEQNSSWILLEYHSPLRGEINFIVCKLMRKDAVPVPVPVGGEPDILEEDGPMI